MIDYSLNLRFKIAFVKTARGVHVANTFIPEHLIKSIDEKQKSITLCSGWKLYEQGNEFVIAFHQLVIRLDANLIECIQTRSRL